MKRIKNSNQLTFDNFIEFSTSISPVISQTARFIYILGGIKMMDIKMIKFTCPVCFFVSKRPELEKDDAIFCDDCNLTFEVILRNKVKIGKKIYEFSDCDLDDSKDNLVLIEAVIDEDWGE